jgi:formate dehydrogenase maturation protein FdhE
MENTENVEITSPISVERSKKHKVPKIPKVKPEKKKEYDQRYRGKLHENIATKAIEKYMETIKQEAPVPEKEKQEAPSIMIPDKQEFKELPEQLRPGLNFVSKDKYKKLKENFKNIVNEVEEIKKSIHPIPKYNPHVYKALFRR